MILWIDRATAEEWGVLKTMEWKPEMQAWVNRNLRSGASLKQFDNRFGVEFNSDRDRDIFRLWLMPHYAAA